MGGKPAAAAGSTVRQFTAAGPLASTGASKVSLAELAAGLIESGQLEATVPLRAGEAFIPVSAGNKPLEITIEPRTQAKVTAQIGPGPDGPVLSSVRIEFRPGLALHNLSALEHSPRATLGETFSTAILDGIVVDARGNARPLGTVELFHVPIVGGPVVDIATVAPALPKLDVRLASFFDGSAQVPSLPGLPGPDPKKLLGALGAIVDKAQFSVALSTKADVAVDASGSVAKNADGNVQLAVTTGTLRVGKTSVTLDGGNVSAKPDIVNNKVTVHYDVPANAQVAGFAVSGAIRGDADLAITKLS